MIDLETTDLSTLEAVLTTDKGEMVVGFFPEAAPGHVKNFLSLAQNGFYDGLAFHRIVRNFMIQGGCPHSKQGAKGQPGTGDPGYKLPAEFSDIPHTRGVLSAARARDPNSAGSQFFVVHADHADLLDGQYKVFGRVEDGLDVLDAIASIECEIGPGGEKSVTKERVEIQRIELRPRQERAPDGGDGDE
jgi:peptidyl-prolyl cis-trans isomerase B (cyclophilin B)